MDCHAIFAEHYRRNKHCFTSIPKDIGLGIGIDYGEVQIVQIGADFTVVGTPVVYEITIKHEGKTLAYSVQLNGKEFEPGLAKALGINQAAVSKMERRTDMYISTLRQFVTAMGGELEITARFPDGAIRILQFEDAEAG